MPILPRKRDDNEKTRLSLAPSISGGGAVQSSSGGSALTVREIDGTPLVLNVNTIQVTNGTLTDNGAGNVTISIGGAALNDPGGNGIVVRTALNTTTPRTITGTLNRITVTNGDGVAGNPTLDVGSLVAINTNRIDQNNIGPTSSAQLAGVISDETGSGLLVFNTSPTFVTPLLGTPTSGVLTNCTGYTTANLAGAAAGVLTFLGTPSSANLLAAVTDETGTGLLVFATNPVLTTPNIGTPSAGTLTNTTGFPVANLAGAGAGVLTFLATPSSANLAAAITNETGSGLVVFNTAPSLTGLVSVVASGAAAVGLIVDSAASPTADIIQIRQNTSSTAAFAVKPDGMFTFPGLKVLAANFSAVATTTYATITGFSVNVRAGRTYSIKVVLSVTKDATGLAKAKIAGTATMTGFQVCRDVMNSSDNNQIGCGESAFNTDITEGFNIGTGNTYILTISGGFVVNAAGTVEVQFAQQVASGTSTVTAFSSTMEVIEMQ